MCPLLQVWLPRHVTSIWCVHCCRFGYPDVLLQSDVSTVAGLATQTCYFNLMCPLSQVWLPRRVTSIWYVHCRRFGYPDVLLQSDVSTVAGLATQTCYSNLMCPLSQVWLPRRVTSIWCVHCCRFGYPDVLLQSDVSTVAGLATQTRFTCPACRRSWQPGESRRSVLRVVPLRFDLWWEDMQAGLRLQIWQQPSSLRHLTKPAWCYKDEMKRGVNNVRWKEDFMQVS